jgi:type I restriction enzyme S subunit
MMETATKSIQRYPAYKDSGINEVGDIPEEWQVTPIFSVMKPKSITNRENEELLSVYLDLGVIKFSDINEKRTNVTSKDLSNYQLVEPGDFVLNNQQAWRGSVGVSKHKGIVSPAYIILELDKSLYSTYANYLLRNSSMVTQYLISSKGVGTIQRNLYWPSLRRSSIVIPPLPEQTAIAHFLDDKTEKIDRAVSIKEKQIALLKERRQIIIQELVTGKKVWNEAKQTWEKPEKTKDSGVEWIGEIPEEWEVVRLKKLIKNLEGGVSVNASESESAKEGEVGVLKTSSVYTYSFNKNENKKVFKTDLNRVRCPVKKGCIIISRMNAPGLVGASGYVSEECHNLYLPDRLWQTVFYSNISFDSYWLSLILNSIGFRDVITSLANGSSPSMKNISKPDFLNISIPFTDYSNQQKTVGHIEAQSQKIDQAISIKEREIEKLKEYKASLVNDVVLGKIKII